MIISNLNYLEAAPQDVNVQGGLATANSLATALANGLFTANTVTGTSTNAGAILFGYASASGATSASFAI